MTDVVLESIPIGVLLPSPVLLARLIQPCGEGLDAGRIARAAPGQDLLVKRVLIVGIERKGELGLPDRKLRLLCADVKDSQQVVRRLVLRVQRRGLSGGRDSCGQLRAVVIGGALGKLLGERYWSSGSSGCSRACASNRARDSPGWCV